ncbi:MAG: hypothetical protein WCG98_02470 [bacterium]
MGINNDGTPATSFNPNGVVTRAQFGTVLSRALYGDTYNGGNPYYADHLQALKDASPSIMTDISKPNAPEVRGYVMLMMQRANGGSTPAVCETPENVLSCSLGLDTCPSQCKTQVVKAGTLTLTSTPADYNSIPSTGAVKHATVTFKAGSEDVTVYSVTMKKTSLATLGNATRMYFEKNGMRVTSKAAFSEDKATLSFNTAFTIKAGSTETLDLYLYVEGSAGDEYQFASTDINSSAADVNGSITTPLLRAVNYTLAQVTLSNVADAASYKVDSTKLVELGSFKVAVTASTQGTKNLLFKGITLYQSGTSDLSYLTDLGLYRDEAKISSAAIVNGRNISFVLDDTIKYTSSSATYVIKGKIANADRIGDTYGFLVKNPENIDMKEDTTKFQVSVVNPTTTVPLSVMIVNGADLKFNQLTTSYTKQIVPGAKNVVFFTGTLQSLGTVTLEDFTGTMTASLSGLNQVFTTIYMKVGNTVLSAAAPTTATAAIKFEGTVTVNGTVPFIIYADIKDTASAQTVKFNEGVSLASFKGTNEYSDGEIITSAIGSLSPITNTIVAANLQFTNTQTSTQTVQKNGLDITMANLEFATTTDIISKIYSFKATISGYNNTTGNNMYNFAGGVVTVYDKNGTALVSDNIVSGTNYVTFVLPNALSVSKGNPVNLTVKLDRVANTVTGNDQLKLVFNTVNAKNFITSNSIDPTPTSLNSALLNVVNAGTVSVVAQSFTPLLVKMNGGTATIGTLKFKPFNGDAVLKNLTLSGTDTTPFSKVVLTDGTDEYTFVKSGSTDLWLDGINKTLSMNVTKTYSVVATLKTASTANDLIAGYALGLLSANFESLNGAAIVATTVPAVVGPTIKFVNAKPEVKLVSLTRVGNNAVYKFTVASSGGDIKLGSGVFTVTNNTDTTGSFLTGTLWLGNEGGTNLGTVVANGTATFPGLSTLVNITDGTVASFTLVIPVANWYKSTVKGNIGVEVNNISYIDTFSDATEVTHPEIFTTYKWDIAPVSTSAVVE